MMTVESNEESTSTPKSSNASATDRISSKQQGVESQALQGAVSTNIDPFAARPSHQLSWANVNMKVSRKGKPDIQVLSNVEGSVNPRELSCIIGHSGSGKVSS
jgi:ABC-type multidrug transport system fused ATPase/permease subunit